MKKQILNIGKALSRAEQKEVNGGGNMSLSLDGTSGGGCWVSCRNGGTYPTLDCEGWADGMCAGVNSTFSSCSCW